MSEDVSFRFEGRTIAARAGMTLGAALAASGEHRLRQTREGPERGLFCGMGVCQDCLVTVDGEPNQRACVVKAKAGMAVTRQGFPGALPPAVRGSVPIASTDLSERTADLVVVGGGAGGLRAALEACRAGLDVLLLDERPTAGGQYYKQAAGDAGPLDEQQRQGAALRAAVEQAGVRIIDQAEVWSPFEGLALLVTAAGASFVARGRALVIATGAYQRVAPRPGWTLPGVMTTGAVQTLWRSYRALPGNRVLVAGNGPLNLQVACEVMAGGASVPAIIEAAEVLSPARVSAAAAMAWSDPRLTRQGLSLLASARRRGAGLRFGQVVRRISQGDGGLVVETGAAAGGPAERWTVDVVALGDGFLPSNELLRALGAAHDADPATGHLRTCRDGDGLTTVEGLYAVGDCAGPGGAPAAEAEGVIAGVAVARRLGVAPGSVQLAAEAAARRDRQRHRRFQAALWQLYAAPQPGLSLADDATLVCRCEEVDKASLMAALNDGKPDIGEIKRRTRCGMGRCQGRYCAATIVAEVAARTGHAPDERAFFAPRGPIKPVTIRDLVAHPGGGRASE